jgi:hypothetical protein
MTALHNRKTDEVLIILADDPTHITLTRDEAQRFADELAYALANKPKKNEWGELIHEKDRPNAATDWDSPIGDKAS